MDIGTRRDKDISEDQGPNSCLQIVATSIVPPISISCSSIHTDLREAHATKPGDVTCGWGVREKKESDGYSP